MPKSDNKHAINLYNSIEKHLGHAEAEDFLEKLPLSASADYVKKSKWARAVCAYLEERYPADEIRRIRMDCSCNPGGKAEKAKVLFDASVDYDDFCARFNREYAPGNSLSHDGTAFYFTYPTCYCSYVKRGEGKLTSSWCVCTLGYTEKLFSHALGRAVTVELLESVMTGGEKCVMRIT